jgi:hypothetical protein
MPSQDATSDGARISVEVVITVEPVDDVDVGLEVVGMLIEEVDEVSKTVVDAPAVVEDVAKDVVVKLVDVGSVDGILVDEGPRVDVVSTVRSRSLMHCLLHSSSSILSQMVMSFVTTA